jgi:hypothetical protein
MTSKWQIAQYWASDEGYARWPSLIIDIGEPSCMACGYYRESWDEPKALGRRWEKASLEKAHIVARSIGGPDIPSNYVLLCGKCHADAPMTNADSVMFVWCNNRQSFCNSVAECIRKEALAIDPSLKMFETLSHLTRDELWAALTKASEAIGAGAHGWQLTHSTLALTAKAAADAVLANRESHSAPPPASTPPPASAPAPAASGLDFGPLFGGKP